MAKRKLPLQPHEDRLLRQLYLSFRIPIDQYAQRPQLKASFIQQWNELSGRDDSAEDVIHYMVTLRKQKLWVTFDGDYEPLACPGEDSLSPEEWAELAAVYGELNRGRDNYASDSNLCLQLAEGFAERAGRYVSGQQLYAAIMARQKRGEWLHVDRPDDEPGIGFSDIDEVA